MGSRSLVELIPLGFFHLDSLVLVLKGFGWLYSQQLLLSRKIKTIVQSSE